MPKQTSVGPNKSGGAVTFTEIVAELEQLFPSVTVYVIKEDPGDIPLTIPLESIVAIAVFPLDQVPPGVVLNSVVVVKGHKLVFPVIEFMEGNGLIVKFEALVAFPIGLATLMVPEVAPEGNIAVI